MVPKEDQILTILSQHKSTLENLILHINKLNNEIITNKQMIITLNTKLEKLIISKEE